MESVTIFVRRRKITRQGAKVEGYQVGFTRGAGGATSTSKEDAIEYQRGVAKRYGFTVEQIVEEPNR